MNERFEASRIESKYFINNLGTFYLILVIYLASFILWLVIKLLQCWFCC